MDPLSLLRAALPSPEASRLEGRVESSDDRRGTVTVRLPGGVTVVAQGSDLKAGDSVLVARASDGSWVARPGMRPTPGGMAGPDLSALFGAVASLELSKAAVTRDPTRIATAMQRIWTEVLARPADSLPEALQAARARGLPPLVSLAAPGTSPRVVSGGLSPLALREETSPGVYRAEIAGRASQLAGPSGLSRGELGLWTESVLDDILSLWLPAEVETAGPPALPARVGADLNGARRLLDRLGVPAPAATDPSLGSLVRTLVRAAALLDDTSGEPGRPGSGLAGEVRFQEAGNKIPSSAGGAVAGFVVDNPDFAPTGRSVQPTGTGSLPVPSLPGGANEGIGSPLKDPELGVSAPVASSGTLPTGTPVPVPSAAPPSPMPGPVAGSDSAFALRATVPSPLPSAPLPDVAPPDMPAGAGILTESVASRDATLAPRPSQLPAATALRVLLAWALSDGEPTDAALRAAVGDAPELPDALETLGRILDRDPERFPAVGAFLAAREPESPLLPRQLGLEKHAPSQAPSSLQIPSANTLAEALASDLGAALAQGRPEEAQVLRDALRSLASEGFGAARDPRDPVASSPWSLAPRQDRPDAGKVMVHDRRKNRDDPARGLVVDVAMDPTGLGGVDARLELRGRDLDVRFSTRQPETAKTISEHLPELRKLLLGLGFEPRELDARAGKTHATRPSTDPRDGSTALDIRA